MSGTSSWAGRQWVRVDDPRITELADAAAHVLEHDGHADWCSLAEDLSGYDDRPACDCGRSELAAALAAVREMQEGTE